MGLDPGTYTPNLDVEVSVWNDPDSNGDGTPVLDEFGDPKKDDQGREIKRYNPPKGFVNKVPVNEHGVVSGENYVLQDDNREVVRDVDGNAISISEGQAVVRHQDGTVEVLTTEADKRRFAKGYSKQSGPSTVPGAAKTDQAPTTTDTQAVPDVQAQPPAPGTDTTGAATGGGNTPTAIPGALAGGV